MTPFPTLDLEALDHVLGGNTDAPPFPYEEPESGMQTTSPDFSSGLEPFEGVGTEM